VDEMQIRENVLYFHPGLNTHLFVKVSQQGEGPFPVFDLRVKLPLFTRLPV